MLSCSNSGRESDGRRRLDAVFTGHICKTSKVCIRSLAMLERLKAVKDLFINNTFEVALEESGSERWRRSRLYRITLLWLLSISDRFKQAVVDLFAENHSFLRQRHSSRLEVVFLHLFLFV